MRIAVAQIDPVVGAFQHNVKLIKESIKEAQVFKADILLLPELSICGYPPHDLLERPEIFERNDAALQEIQKFTQDKAIAVVVGHVTRNTNDSGRPAQNMASVVCAGEIVFQQAKTLLPTYDVFDEVRYFEPAEKIELWQFKGKKIALAVCEDLWADDSVMGRSLYGGAKPQEQYQKMGVDLVLSLSASPYEFDKRSRREQLHQNIARTLSCPVVYCNQVGATDEILFDGGSFASNEKGELIDRLPLFQNALRPIDLDGGVHDLEDQKTSEISVLARGLIRGIKEYFFRTGFKKAIIGLSGGIDSTVVAVLAKEALGAENVLGVAMPAQYSSAESLEDAQELARRLKIKFEVRPIKFPFATLSRELADGSGQLAEIAKENLQARLRGLFLMTFANHYNALVLTTGNKSELATGYCTQYGDMVGAIAPLGDLLKTRVFELARQLNREYGDPIPERCITKPPSAELKPDQKDEDTLPPYDKLDQVLELYIEKRLPVQEIASRFAGESWVADTLRRLELNEYKRRQAAPAFKVSQKAFGVGRRIPIAKTWDK